MNEVKLLQVEFVKKNTLNLQLQEQDVLEEKGISWIPLTFLTKTEESSCLNRQA